MKREEIIHMARETGFNPVNFMGGNLELFERFFHAAYATGAAAEREACARVCEQADEDGEGPDCWDWNSKDYAAAIRARAKK